MTLRVPNWGIQGNTLRAYLRRIQRSLRESGEIASQANTNWWYVAQPIQPERYAILPINPSPVRIWSVRQRYIEATVKSASSLRMVGFNLYMIVDSR